ncbi:MAG: ATPase, T2SS/T4P/T4SS family [Planctomycetota bacterium]
MTTSTPTSPNPAADANAGPTPRPATAVFQTTVEHYLAPVRQYLEDAQVAEVMINAFDDIFIEKDGQLHKVAARFPDKEAYEAAVNNILQFTGKSLSDDDHLVDARLPDGSRVHVAKEPCARFGMATTIRKFSRQMLDIDWLIQLGTLTPAAKEYLQLAVRAEQNLMVAGGTSSGKTSLLNCLSAFIPQGQRIVVIEDSAELQLQQDHLISLEAKAPDRFGRGAVVIRDLFRSSLRLRPDRIIIGEVRGGEALDMIQAMTSGHGGSMTTLHANNTVDALNRLETMALMSEVELPLAALRSQVASAMDVVVHLSRQIGGRRMVTQVSEVDPLGDDGYYQTRDIFRLQPAPTPDNPNTMQLAPTGERSALGEVLRHHGQEPSELTADLFSLA